jgi:hypothetical protein
MSDDFYAKIPAFRDRGGLSDPANYHEAPADWLVVLSDVRGSTVAIEAGRYKDVNIVGASAIIAILNAVGRAPIPYVFGGDGATLLVPPGMRAAVTEALLGARQAARDKFGLELRIGIVPLADLAPSGQAVRVAKFAVSDDFSLAMFGGGGLSQAEHLLKKSPAPNPYLLEGEPLDPGDFTGLECRWQPMPAKKGEILSVLVRALSPDRAVELGTYREIIEELEAIVGRVESASPVAQPPRRLASTPGQLRAEHQLRGGSLFRLWLNTLAGKLFFALNLKVFGVDWGKYRKEVARNSDFWKYDDVLRFVIDVTPAQKRALTACLESRSLKGQVVFGIHSSREALMTCLVFSHQGNHVHFIDGGDGGYAMAAKQMKEQAAKL